MTDILTLLLCVVASRFKSRRQLEVENAALRQQLVVLRRGALKRSHLTNGDRLSFIWLYRLCPSVLKAITIVRPETRIRWHRRGLRTYWRWRSRPRGGRPRLPSEISNFI